MKTSSHANRWLLAAPVVIAAVIAVVMTNSGGRPPLSAAPPNPKSVTATVQFTPEGHLIQPNGYRRWTYVGTPLTPNDMNGGQAAFPEFHSVYIDPDALAHFEKTGEFADGTVLVKELISVGTKQATSGKGYFMGDFTGLEVAIKDSVRFKDEPGHWAYFSFGHEYPLAEISSVQPAVNCNACHAGAAENDYVFTQYYPVLRATASKEPKQ